MTKQIIGQKHLSDGLYTLDSSVPQSVRIICWSTLLVKDMYLMASTFFMGGLYQLLFQCHLSIGRPLPFGPSFPSHIKRLCPEFYDICSLDCESSQLAKHHCSSLGSRMNIPVTSAFKLVQLDVRDLVLLEQNLSSDT